MADLIRSIADRKQVPPDQSYTASLLSKGIEKCAKKFGEEAFEIALAAVGGNKSRVISEAADVVYHLLVLLESTGVTVSEVMTELERRQGTSGIVEKAGRAKD
ncbi:MAG: phosphoribosyl-ATP diphosphatase [Alphaproteobacteria bacterium]|nr:phosphoribosyl-ATP diphosphatase [Alphaproteobacteria bacterium]